MKVILILGCWGRAEDGITACCGIENEVLDITSDSKMNVAITEYLDTNFNIFDRPIYNNIHTAVWNIQERFSDKKGAVFPKRMFERMEEFCSMHVKCGLFLRLEIQDEKE